MSSKLSLQPLCHLRFAAIVLGLAAATALPACAQQQASQPVASQGAVASQNGTQNLELFSTSATGLQDDAVTDERANLSGQHIGPNADANPQYGGGYGGPPRRRPYGRPTYKDRNSNADGSSKYAFEAGAGFTMPTGISGPLLTPSYKFQFGAGRNFNKMFGVLLEYNYDHFGINNRELTTELNTLNASINAYNQQQTNPANIIDPLQQLGGNAHTWSFTVEPVINFYNRGKTGAYIIGGGGFYRKITNFTTPSQGEECDEFGDCFEVSADQTVQNFSNNAGGLNIGGGLTWKPSQYSNLKLFAEARYTWVDNSASPNNATAGPPQYGYPPANFRTEYIPVTFGVRF